MSPPDADLPPEPSAPPQAVVVRWADTREAADTFALALAALAIPYDLHRTEDGRFAVIVPMPFAGQALRVLAAQERDALEMAAAHEPAAPDRGPTFAGSALAVALVCFFIVTGGRGTGAVWFARGTASSDAILRGEWWRAITALTLHADWAHVFGNAIAGIVFVSAVCRWLGAGVGLALVLLAGTAGNLATAALAGTGHNSVGASTAIFGALGVLGGLQVSRKWRARDAVRGRWARALPILGACLGVFAMLGVGERGDVDVLAHLTGLLAGLLLGLVAARFPARAATRWSWLGDAGLVAASTGVVVGCWLLALWHR